MSEERCRVAAICPAKQILRETGASMAASLSDVARAAGTSVTTASRVLNHARHAVAEETRKRVLRAAQELGFTPNALARALAKRMAQVVGVIVGDITDPYFAEIARGAGDVAGAHGHLTIVCNGDRNLATEQRYFGMLKDHCAAGVVFAGGAFLGMPEGSVLAASVGEIAGTNTRVVCLAERGLEGVATFSVDERAVLSDITRHVIRLGHRSIAFVEGPEGLSTSVLRLQGFQQAMREHGLDPALRFSGGFGVESGRAAAAAMLATSLPDAIIAATDETAVGVLLTLRQAGVDVPRQVSVAGVDDSRYSRIMDLTTVRLPAYELGALGARYVLGLSGSSPTTGAYLPHRVVPRGTTAWAARCHGGRHA
jgi:LacI family transcriptional regulator